MAGSGSDFPRADSSRPGCRASSIAENLRVGTGVRQPGFQSGPHCLLACLPRSCFLSCQMEAMISPVCEAFGTKLITLSAQQLLTLVLNCLYSSFIFIITATQDFVCRIAWVSLSLIKPVLISLDTFQSSSCLIKLTPPACCYRGMPLAAASLPLP